MEKKKTKINQASKAKTKKENTKEAQKTTTIPSEVEKATTKETGQQIALLLAAQVAYSNPISRKVYVHVRWKAKTIKV